MIKITAKYNDKKQFTATTYNTKKACSAEAIAIIVDMYNMILKNQEDMTIAKINKLVKEGLKEE